MNIGFDLDRVLINYPPFIPPRVIDYLYRHHDKKTLTYRIPHTKVEQFLRRLSHFYFFRPAIASNVYFVTHFPHNPHPHKLYLISSRYKFLEQLTHDILHRYGMGNVFSSINLNTRNEQPHHFKEKKIKELKVNLYVDDDLDLLKHLAQKCPQTQLLWYNPLQIKRTDLGRIIEINKLSEMKSYLKET